MTPIEISERLIAVEVPKDIKNPEIVQGAFTFKYWLISYNSTPKRLPDGYSYKYTCLLSDLADCKYAIQFSVGEIVLIHERVKPNKEYALIAREKEK